MPLFIVACRPFFCFLILPSNQHMFFVPQISQIHTDSWLGFKVTQISQMTQMIGDDRRSRTVKKLKIKHQKDKDKRIFCIFA